MTDSQFAANRANAANSTGPRTTNGKARSSQNARKHGFAAAAYTVPRLEDLDEVAFLREGAIKLYQPANAQELFAVERIAITEHAMNRAARLEAGTFTICLNDVLNLREPPLMEMDPEMYGGGEPGKEQVKNYLLAEGFRRSVGNSNAMHLCIRYSAQSERLYRRAVEDLDRIRGAGRDAHDFCGPACLPRVLPDPHRTPPRPNEPKSTRTPTNRTTYPLRSPCPSRSRFRQPLGPVALVHPAPMPPRLHLPEMPRRSSREGALGRRKLKSEKQRAAVLAPRGRAS